MPRTQTISKVTGAFLGAAWPAGVMLAIMTTASAPCANEAVAGPVPETERLWTLQSKCDRASYLAITSSRGVLQSRRVAVDSGGILLEAPMEQTLSTLGTRPTDRTIAWNDVERIDATSSGAGRGLVMGALTGALLAGAFIVSTNGSNPRYWEEGGALGLGVMFTAATSVVGCGIGALFPRHDRLYP